MPAISTELNWLCIHDSNFAGLEFNVEAGDHTYIEGSDRMMESQVMSVIRNLRDQ